MERKETTSSSSPEGATGGARKKTSKSKDSDNTQLSGTASELQRQLQAVTEHMSHAYNPRRQPVPSPSPAPPLQAPPLDSKLSSQHPMWAKIKLFDKTFKLLEFQKKRIKELEEVVLSMYKCIQNLERIIPQQSSVIPTSTSTELQTRDSLVGLNAQTQSVQGPSQPQSMPSVESQMSDLDLAPQTQASDC